ncbi:hypothetical protein C2W62_16240 [Candidatus Entotheonella serta]|nr:hypothetical protein C2W62_16240 [Candidatus Entotheonella serta]
MNTLPHLHLHGKLDDVRIYAHALTAAEVANLHADTLGGSSDTDAVAITVNPMNDAPVLTVVTPALSDINEDDINNPGDLISSILSGAVSDVDDGANEGIALVGVNDANGTWSYTTNGGGVWNPVGAVTNNSARLLAADANTRLRFEPNPDDHGTLSPAIVFRAWDQTEGVKGGTADTGAGGGTNAFSTATDTAEMTINAVNDRPTATIISPSYNVLENTPHPLHGTGLDVADVDAEFNSVLALLSVGEGTLVVGAGSTGVTVTNSGTANVTLDGILSQIKNLLDGKAGASITYHPIETPSVTTTFTLSLDDLGHSGAGGPRSANDIATLNITAENDDPSNVGSLPPNAIVTEDITSHINLSVIDLFDPDAATGSLTVTLSKCLYKNIFMI